MNTKYLAYIALLAGWLFFCYWLYERELYPRFHAAKGTTWPVVDKDLQIPLGFTWGSEIPIAGDGFNEWAEGMKKIDSGGNILILRGNYFRDETESLEKGKALGLRRVNRMIKYLELSKERIIIEVIPKEIDADVRIKPFEAFRLESVDRENVMNIKEDTFEICFPLKDSLVLPPAVNTRINEWLEKQTANQESNIYLFGTADGTGISESADMGWERAIAIKQILVQHRWEEDHIIISTGQRNFPESIRNRCVVLFIE